MIAPAFTKHFWAHCTPCRREWIAFVIPPDGIALDVVVAAVRAVRCPTCGTTKVFCGQLTNDGCQAPGASAAP